MYWILKIVFPIPSGSFYMVSFYKRFDHCFKIITNTLLFFFVNFLSRIAIRLIFIISLSVIRIIVVVVNALLLTFFLSSDTWNTGWIMVLSGNSSLYATSPALYMIL